MARAQNSGTRITIVFMLIALGLATYFIAPLFLPVWGWLYLDFDELAAKHSVPVEQINQEYTMVIRYANRGNGDPCPWQLVYMDPEYEYSDIDEWHVAVRINLLSDYTGEPPGTLTMGTTARDHYFKIKGYRFPPGFFEIKSKRPVVVYHGDSKEMLSITESRDWEGRIKREWDNDDLWPERDDGWVEVEEEADAEEEDKPPSKDDWILPE